MSEVEAIFRRAEASDAGCVADVYLRSRRTFLPYAPMAHADDEVREWIAIVLVASGRVTVAVVDGRIVGMMALSQDGDIGWIDQLYLEPAYTGRGIGAGFLAIAKRELSCSIRLYTFQANNGACRFYERHGFRVVAKTDGRDNEEKCPDVLYDYD